MIAPSVYKTKTNKNN